MRHSDDDLRQSKAHVLVDSIAVPVLDDETTHHLFRVLRVGDGQLVTITDGRGSWRRCRAVGIELCIDGEVQSVGTPQNPLTVGFAIPKQDRPEWIVQKLTELGVDRIVLIEAERSVVRWDDQRAAKRLTKLNRIVIEALQQSRRMWCPQIVGPLPSHEILPTAVAAEPGGRKIGGDDRTIAIGPEGGWTPTELSIASDTVALATSVLRVETAAVAAAAIVGSV